MPKYFKFFIFTALILLTIYSIWASLALQNYQKIDKNNIPAFVIQENKLSPKSINDLTKLSDAKNIWLIADDKDFKKANELIKQSADAISYANQVGRLDLVSILLGIIAIIFGFAGIVGFLHIKNIVEAQIDQAIKKAICLILDYFLPLTTRLKFFLTKRFKSLKEDDNQEDQKEYYKNLFEREFKEDDNPKK